MSDWTWDWDRMTAKGGILKKDAGITRWRRGWVTLYRIETETEVEWHLHFPFGFHVGWTRNIDV